MTTKINPVTALCEKSAVAAIAVVEFDYLRNKDRAANEGDMPLWMPLTIACEGLTAVRMRNTARIAGTHADAQRFYNTLIQSLNGDCFRATPVLRKWRGRWTKLLQSYLPG